MLTTAYPRKISDMDASEQLRLAAKRARERKDLRQEDVAAQLQQLGINITSNAYAKFEGGTRGGKFDEVSAIAQVLELDLNAIARSGGIDVEDWLTRTAEANFKNAEEALEEARDEFEDFARYRRLTADMLSALSGEAVQIRGPKRDFVGRVLGQAIREIPDDLADFFESRGDDGEVRAAITEYNSAAAAGRERRRAGAPGLSLRPENAQKCWDRIAAVLEKIAPGLEFPDD